MFHLKKERNNYDKTQFVDSINEEDSGARQSRKGVSHFANSGVVDESSEEEQDA